MFGSLIFFSNSIPKSGSSLLFNLQRDFLMGLNGQNVCDYSSLEKRGIPVSGGFLATKDIPALIDALESGMRPGGPLILKVHTPITPALRALYEANDNFYMSLIVRDPLDSLLSAMDNYRRTGEFQNFRTIEEGCTTVTNFFKSIYESSVKITAKPVPVVHYSDLKSDPVATVAASFHHGLRDRIIRSIIERNLDLKVSSKKASHRLQSGGLSRNISEIPENKRDYVLEALRDFRGKMGYGD